MVVGEMYQFPIFVSFISEIGLPKGDVLGYFQINGRRDSSEKIKLINSGNEFFYTNWNSDEPENNLGFDYVYIRLDDNNSFSKWETIKLNSYLYVICKHKHKMQINKEMLC